MDHLSFDEFCKLTRLDLQEVLFMVDNKVIDVQKEENDLIFNDYSVKTIKLVESFMELGYDLENAAKIIKNIGEPKTGTVQDDKFRKKRNLYTPGELAKLFNVSPRAVKYWEEKKLIKPYTRSKTGIRFYHKKTIIDIMLLKDFQNLGFSLSEIKIFLDLYQFVLTTHNKQKDPEKAEEFLKHLDKLDNTLKEYQSSIETLEQLSAKGRQKLNVIIKLST